MQGDRMPIGLRLDYLVYCRNRNHQTEQEIGDVGEYVEIHAVGAERGIYNDQFRADVVVDCESQFSDQRGCTAAVSYSSGRTLGASSAYRSHTEKVTKESLDLISSERRVRRLTDRSD